MTVADWIGVSLTAVSVLLLPALVILVRGAIKWTRTEDKLGTLVEQVRQLIAGKDRAHQEIIVNTAKIHAEFMEQMRADREATGRRLRFTEEAWMRLGRERMPGADR